MVTVSKAQKRQGEKANLKNFEFTQNALRQLFAIIGSFYEYLSGRICLSESHQDDKAKKQIH